MDQFSRHVRVFPDYGVTYPLWGLSGALEDGDELERDLGISSVLLADLAAWQDAWDKPNDRAAFRRLEAEIKVLHRRLQHEARPGVSFELRYPSRQTRQGRIRRLVVDPIWRIRRGRPCDWPDG